MSESNEIDLHAQAIAEGYKDEVCKECGVMFLAHIHFIRCDHSKCPMSSGKTFFEMWLEETK